MQKKIFAVAAILFIFNFAYAETCPTVAELKSNAFQQHGWQALDTDNGEPLSPEALSEFQQNVKTFSLATWLEDAPEGAGQCYYSGDDPEPHMGVYIVKQTGAPDKTKGNWHWVDDVMECYAGLLACLYQN